MVVAIATTYQAKNLGSLTPEQLGTWWPLFVVLFGLLYILGKARRRRSTTVAVDNSDGDVSVVSLFGASEDERPRATSSTAIRTSSSLAWRCSVVSASPCEQRVSTSVESPGVTRFIQSRQPKRR